jgi:hypothetical protein
MKRTAGFYVEASAFALRASTFALRAPADKTADTGVSCATDSYSGSAKL